MTSVSALTQQLQHEVELGPRRLRPGGGIDVNVALGDTSPGQRIGLVGGILLGGGHTRVPISMRMTITRTADVSRR